MGTNILFKGNGIPYRFFTYAGEKLTFTVGHFYEQFGNGIILRTYEERGLGYDNVIDGIRVIYQVAPGFRLKGVIGQQRIFFDQGEGIVRGYCFFRRTPAQKFHHHRIRNPLI